ncbi:cation transporter [Sorangium sp. So ce295]|uniref:cation diffusion facilitator family transporter n=1 Tax=Sorangium sp. So ce295 TaxID=3133295 RepID=UPI003F62B35D
MSSIATSNRTELLQRALRLEYLTVGWNVVEGVIAVTAALAAGSVALLGFGVDSFVESLSGSVLIWRLKAEGGKRDHEEIERIEHRARKLVAVSLFALAAYITFDAGKALWLKEMPETSLVGIVLTAISLAVMLWLARAKRRAAAALGSRAMAADAFQTTACWWLSLITFGGIGINALFGWWWADPLAALGVAYFLVHEGREAWEGKDECCE